MGGISEILDRDFINTKVKESGLEILGIMIDADENPGGRWESLRSIFEYLLSDIPMNIPSKGFIGKSNNGLRIGFWIMPNCSSKGMLEDFLQYLVPDDCQDLWNHAQASFRSALKYGAPCQNSHASKAAIHTWLAWQEPPGERFGAALSQKILDPHADSAMPFVGWFKKLYLL
jgi:hypothetical protein